MTDLSFNGYPGSISHINNQRIGRSTGSVAWAGVISGTAARAAGFGVLFMRPRRFSRRSRKRNQMASDDEAFRVRFRKGCKLDIPRRRPIRDLMRTSSRPPSYPTGNAFPVAMTKGQDCLPAPVLSSRTPPQMPLDGGEHVPGAATGAGRPAGEFGQAAGRTVNEASPTRMLNDCALQAVSLRPPAISDK